MCCPQNSPSGSLMKSSGRGPMSRAAHSASLRLVAAHPPDDISPGSAGSDVDAQHLRATPHRGDEDVVDYVHPVDVRIASIGTPHVGIGRERQGEAVLHAILDGHVAPGVPGEDGTPPWRDDLDRRVVDADGGDIGPVEIRQIDVAEVARRPFVCHDQVVAVLQNLEVVGVVASQRRPRCSRRRQPPRSPRPGWCSCRSQPKTRSGMHRRRRPGGT